jgi:hypothetical protein
MTLREKKMKAAAIAVTCFMQQDVEGNCESAVSGWSKMGKNIIMNGRDLAQRKSRSL